MCFWYLGYGFHLFSSLATHADWNGLLVIGYWSLIRTSLGGYSLCIFSRSTCRKATEFEFETENELSAPIGARLSYHELTQLDQLGWEVSGTAARVPRQHLRIKSLVWLGWKVMTSARVAKDISGMCVGTALLWLTLGGSSIASVQHPLCRLASRACMWMTLRSVILGQGCWKLAVE